MLLVIRKLIQGNFIESITFLYFHKRLSRYYLAIVNLNSSSCECDIRKDNGTGFTDPGDRCLEDFGTACLIHKKFEQWHFVVS